VLHRRLWMRLFEPQGSARWVGENRAETALRVTGGNQFGRVRIEMVLACREAERGVTEQLLSAEIDEPHH
jgi:hypothetical protein